MTRQPENIKPVKTPEQWLEAAAPEKTAGILKVFLATRPALAKHSACSAKPFGAAIEAKMWSLDLSKPISAPA